MSITKNRGHNSKLKAPGVLLKLELQEYSQNDNTVDGFLHTDSSKDIQIHGILLSIVGDVWTEITPCPNEKRKYSSNIFVQASYILGHGSGKTTLAQGKHCLPFTFRLPEHLPSSFIGIYGAITYNVTAQIHSDNEVLDSKWKTSSPLTVKRFLDLSDGFAYGNAISFPSIIERPHKTLKTAMKTNLPLRFVFKVQKTGFALGETIPFVLDLYNPGTTKIATLSVKLMKKTVYGDLKYVKDVFEEMTEVKAVNLDSKSTLTWIGSLHVPLDAIPTHSVVARVPKRKPIFSHSYLLRVNLVPTTGNCLVGDMPVIIGTSKYENRSRCEMTGHIEEQSRQTTIKRQSSMPPSYRHVMTSSFEPRRASVETLPPTYDEAIALASKSLAKETRHLMG